MDTGFGKLIQNLNFWILPHEGGPLDGGAPDSQEVVRRGESDPGDHSLDRADGDCQPKYDLIH